MNIYKKAIQTPFTEQVGWLMLGSLEMDLEDWTTWFEEEIRKLQMEKALLLQRPRGKDIKICLLNKFLFDGVKKSDQPAGRKGVRAIHVEFAKDQKDAGAQLLREVLRSEAFSRRCNLPTRLVPGFKRQSGGEEQKKVVKAIHYQRKAQASISRSNTWDVMDINTPIEKLKNRTIRRNMLDMTTKDSKEKLFFSINQKE